MNAGRHGGATRVEVELAGERARAPSYACATTARASSRPSGESSGLGLQGMAERARLVGGELDVRSAPGAGTEVTMRLP